MGPHLIDIVLRHHCGKCVDVFTELDGLLSLPQAVLALSHSITSLS